MKAQEYKVPLGHPIRLGQPAVGGQALPLKVSDSQAAGLQQQHLMNLSLGKALWREIEKQ